MRKRCCYMIYLFSLVPGMCGSFIGPGAASTLTKQLKPLKTLLLCRGYIRKICKDDIWLGGDMISLIHHFFDVMSYKWVSGKSASNSIPATVYGIDDEVFRPSGFSRQSSILENDMIVRTTFSENGPVLQFSKNNSSKLGHLINYDFLISEIASNYSSFTTWSLYSLKSYRKSLFRVAFLMLSSFGELIYVSLPFKLIELAEYFTIDLYVGFFPFKSIDSWVYFCEGPVAGSFILMGGEKEVHMTYYEVMEHNLPKKGFLRTCFKSDDFVQGGKLAPDGIVFLNRTHFLLLYGCSGASYLSLYTINARSALSKIVFAPSFTCLGLLGEACLPYVYSNRQQQMMLFDPISQVFVKVLNQKSILINPLPILGTKQLIMTDTSCGENRKRLVLCNLVGRQIKRIFAFETVKKEVTRIYYEGLSLPYLKVILYGTLKGDIQYANQFILHKSTGDEISITT